MVAHGMTNGQVNLMGFKQACDGSVVSTGEGADVRALLAQTGDLPEGVKAAIDSTVQNNG